MDRQATRVPNAGPAANRGKVRRPIRDEPGLGQHFLRRDVVQVGCRSESVQHIVFRGDLAQLPQGCRRHPAPRGVLRDSIPEYGRTILEIAEIEQADHRAVVVDQGMEDAGASLLFGEQPVVSLVEVVEKVVATVRDKAGKVDAVRQFEGPYSWGMAGAKTL